MMRKTLRLLFVKNWRGKFSIYSLQLVSCLARSFFGLSLPSCLVARPLIQGFKINLKKLEFKIEILSKHNVQDPLRRLQNGDDHQDFPCDLRGSWVGHSHRLCKKPRLGRCLRAPSCSKKAPRNDSGTAWLSSWTADILQRQRSPLTIPLC